MVHALAGSGSAAALTIVVAMPGAYVLARYDFRGRRLVQAAVTVPFVLPTLVVGTAFLAVGFRPSVTRESSRRTCSSTMP